MIKTKHNIHNYLKISQTLHIEKLNKYLIKKNSKIINRYNDNRNNQIKNRFTKTDRKSL